MKLPGNAVILVLLMYSLASAKTVELTKENLRIDLPDSWTVTPRPVDTYQDTAVLICSAMDDAKTSALEILVCANSHGLMADQAGLVSNVKDSISNSIISRGGQVQFTAENKINLNDVPAYLLQYTITTPASSSSSSPPPMLARAYQFAANRKLYLVSLRTIDAGGDANLQAIADSIRFASPPELPKPPVNHHMLKIALVAGAATGGLIALVAFILFLRRPREF